MDVQKDGRKSSWSFCKICVERKVAKQMFRIGKRCAHAFCSDCVSKHVETQLLDNVSTIKCPGLGCEVVLAFESCRRILPASVVSKWDRALCLAAIPESQKYHCPFKDCSALHIKDHDVRDCECPECHRYFCANCSVPWHTDKSCEEFQSLQEDLDLENLAKEKKWKKCPNCGATVERIAGCPHITCRCKFEFCYGCGSKWSGAHGGCAKY